MYVCLCAVMRTRVQGPRRSEASESLELGAFVSYRTWVLRPELGSPARAVHTPTANFLMGQMNGCDEGTCEKPRGIRSPVITEGSRGQASGCLDD